MQGGRGDAPEEVPGVPGSKGGLHMVGEHIRGVDNVVADALSRDKAQLASSLLQGAVKLPVEVPDGVLDVVARAKPEPGDDDWERLWNFTSTKGWQSPPDGRTRWPGPGT